MKKHNTIKVVLITMLVFLVLSWILPAAYYSGEYIDQGRVQMGLFDLFNYPLTAVAYFGYIALYLLAVGMFQGPDAFRYCAKNVTREMTEELQTQANVL